MKIVTNQNGFVYGKQNNSIYYLVEDEKTRDYIDKETLLKYIRNRVVDNAVITGSSTISPISEQIEFRKIYDADRKKLLNYLGLYKNMLDSQTQDPYEIYDCMEGYSFIIENLKDDKSWERVKKSWYVGLKGNAYYYLFTTTKLLKSIIVDAILLPFGDSKVSKKFLLLASKKINNSIFHFEYYDNFDIPESFKKINIYGKSAGEGYDAKGLCLYHGSYLTEYSENILLESFEKFIFEDSITPEKIVIKDMSSKEINDWVNKMYKKMDYLLSPFWKRDSGFPSMYGFHYFKNHDEIQGVKTLVAMQNNKFLGAIHYGVWNNNKYQSISYIDVAEPYKRKGIATKMIKELNKHLIPNMPLVLTDLSEEGKAAKIDELFKKYITVCKVYTYEEAIRNPKNL